MDLEVIIDNDGKVLDVANAPIEQTEIEYWDTGKVRRLGDIEFDYWDTGRVRHIGNLEIIYWDTGRIRSIDGEDDRIKLTIKGINQ